MSYNCIEDWCKDNSNYEVLYIPQDEGYTLFNLLNIAIDHFKIDLGFNDIKVYTLEKQYRGSRYSPVDTDSEMVIMIEPLIPCFHVFDGVTAFSCILKGRAIQMKTDKMWIDVDASSKVRIFAEDNAFRLKYVKEES